MKYIQLANSNHFPVIIHIIILGIVIECYNYPSRIDILILLCLRYFIAFLETP